jgi:hypothetical protein
MVDAYYTLEAVRADLESQLERLVGVVGDTRNGGSTVSQVGDWVLLGMGVCSGDTTVYCDDDSNCTTGTCANIGAYRCSSNGLPTQTVTACVTDTQCAASTLAGSITSFCLADATRAVETHLALVGFTNATLGSLNNTQQAIMGFEAVRAGAADLNISTIKTDLRDAQDGIIDADVTTYIADLQVRYVLFKPYLYTCLSICVCVCMCV